MILNKDETLCFVLSILRDHNIWGRTKLNKIIARLNLFCVPTELDFELNKYGSECKELSSLNETDFYGFNFKDTSVRQEVQILTLKKENSKEIINSAAAKIKSIMSKEDLTELIQELNELNKLKSNQISENEHIALFVDLEDKHKIRSRVNEVNVDFLDLYDEAKTKLDKTNPNSFKLFCLIEYCFYLSKYLKEHRFKGVEERGYDFEMNMQHYYYLYDLEKAIPFFKEQLNNNLENSQKFKKYYNYFVEFAREKNYPFSFNNPDLDNYFR
jgi:hypothetical protein